MTTKAMVVENNPVLIRAISAFLEKKGCEVKTAPNGLEALNLLKGYVPDILFTDLVMPLIGGEQLCKIIRSNPRLSNIYLVAVSGIVLEDFDNLEAGRYFDLCIAKGHLLDLRSHIEDALQRMLEKQKGKSEETRQLARIPDGLQPSSVAVELLREKRHLHQILDNLGEGIIEIDGSGVVLSVNKASCLLLGQSAEHLIGSDLAVIGWGSHKEKIDEWLAKDLALASGRELHILEGEPLWLNDRIMTVSMLAIHEEGIVYGLCILRDITRQYVAEQHERELSEAMKLMTKMEAMGYMAGGIAHDFNNLLTVICGNLDILAHLGTGELVGDQRSLLEHARSAAYMAVDLTRKISTSSPFGVVSRQTIQLDHIVSRAVERFSRERGFECEVTLAGNGMLVNANGEQIAAALANLLQNGIEAGGEGALQISTQEVVFPTSTILAGQYVPEGAYGCVAVHDKGTGIERQNLHKIFDPYFSTKQRGASKGMGLGLTVVYATIRNHGGYVVVDSAPGEGTAVFCYLPSSGRGEKSVSTDTTCDIPVMVMVVENDGQLREVARLMIEHLGHEVMVAENLAEAREMLRNLQQVPSKIRVVMIDPLQELEVDQELICSQFSNDGPVKMIAIGGSSLDPVMSEFKKYGYCTSLIKPFTLENLRNAIGVCISG